MKEEIGALVAAYEGQEGIDKMTFEDPTLAFNYTETLRKIKTFPFKINLTSS